MTPSRLYTLSDVPAQVKLEDFTRSTTLSTRDSGHSQGGMMSSSIVEGRINQMAPKLSTQKRLSRFLSITSEEAEILLTTTKRKEKSILEKNSHGMTTRTYVWTTVASMGSTFPNHQKQVRAALNLCSSSQFFKVLKMNELRAFVSTPRPNVSEPL